MFVALGIKSPRPQFEPTLKSCMFFFSLSHSFLNLFFICWSPVSDWVSGCAFSHWTRRTFGLGWRRTLQPPPPPPPFPWQIVGIPRLCTSFASGCPEKLQPTHSQSVFFSPRVPKDSINPPTNEFTMKWTFFCGGKPQSCFLWIVSILKG